MQVLITNIKSLLQVRPQGVLKVSGPEMAELPSIENAWLSIQDGLISGFGPMDSCPKETHARRIDANGKVVFPSWCDSHTHLVYASNREGEFVDRINGLSYEEIAARGGGILNSARKLASFSEDELYESASERLRELMRLGTGAIEIKSGYGLTPASELKMLRVIARLKQNFPVPIKATFLGAHAFPPQFKSNPQGYIDEIVETMMPEIAAENLCDYVDAFCETGYFSVDQTAQIVKAAAQYGWPAKLHVNQFTAIGGVQMAVAHNALSVDHLEIVTAQDIESLRNADTMPVALPTCSFFISIPYTPAREMLSAGLPLALASDFNPGTTPSGNMNFVVATACIKMRMTPEEAFNAATLNGAYAMGLSHSHGSVTVGKQANLILTKPIGSFYEIPYSFGSNLIDTVLVNGEVVA